MQTQLAYVRALWMALGTFASARNMEEGLQLVRESQPYLKLIPSDWPA